MIYEFALDPDLVARWHDPREWAFFREAFDADSGRVGSVYPRKWRQDVLRAYHKAVPGASEDSQSRRRLEALLDRLDERMIKREPTHHDCPTWLEKAIAEHRERRFQGILSLTQAPLVPEVMTPDMLFAANPPSAWAVPPCPAPRRSAEALAKAVAPLLLRSRELVFVDPWFDPEKPRFRKGLQAMLETVWGPGRCVGPPEVELLLAESHRPDAPNATCLLDRCRNMLPRIIPAGQAVRVTVLRQRPNSEKIHNRYILTTLAGVSFGIGLDVANEGELGQSDDLFRLSSEQFVKRWGQYVSGRRSCFDIAADPVEIRAER